MSRVCGQWLPDSKKLEGGDYAMHRLLLGTHTSQGEQVSITSQWTTRRVYGSDGIRLDKLSGLC